MIRVSDSFKEAIKNDTREIYGYVEVEYQDKTFDTSVDKIPTSSSLTTTSGIVKNNKILQKYASLEENYTLLDGSFMVWNENNVLESGYISNDIFQNINDNEIVITNNDTTTTTKGITVYFKENLPFNFTVTITDVDGEKIINNVTDNQSYIYQYIFGYETVVSSVSIVINDIEFPKHRLKIASIDFNLSDLYEGEKLVSFEVVEELDLLFDSVPIGTCRVALNNYPDENGVSKFDIINPKGLTSLLTENVKLKPYIGVLTELNGVEYVPMGTFYLKDWTSENNGNVTMNCENLVSRLETTSIASDGNFLQSTHNISYYNTYFSNMTGNTFDLHGTNNFMHQYFLKTFNLMDWLRCFIVSETISYDEEEDVYGKKQFKITRDNIISIDDLSNEICDKISRNELKSDVDYTTKPVISKVKIKNTNYTQSADTSNKKLIDENYTLTQDTEYVWYQLNEMSDFPPSFSYSVVSGSGTAQLVDYNFFMIYVKFTGTVGSVLHVNCTANIHSKTSEKTLTYASDSKTGDTLELDYDQYWNYVISSSDGDLIGNYCLTRDKPYKISLQSMGDPSLEIGDTVSVQTRYTDINDGYKDMVITKQQFTYNGGLECSIEGVGD